MFYVSRPVCWHVQTPELVEDNRCTEYSQNTSGYVWCVAMSAVEDILEDTPTSECCNFSYAIAKYHMSIFIHKTKCSMHVYFASTALEY